MMIDTSSVADYGLTVGQGEYHWVVVHDMLTDYANYPRNIENENLSDLDVEMLWPVIYSSCLGMSPGFREAFRKGEGRLVYKGKRRADHSIEKKSNISVGCAPPSISFYK